MVVSFFRIKSRQMPHMLIKSQSGDYCYGFDEKDIDRKNKARGA